MNNDHDLKHEVLEQLKFDSNVMAGDILVTVANGTVILYGTVPTYAYKVAASKSIEHMYGVLEVTNNLVVKLSDANSRPDSDIRESAMEAICTITTVPLESLTLTVRDGWLKLEGTVELWHQKEAIEIAIRHLRGLVGITDLISVTPLESQLDICTSIKAAFERHGILDARKINVATVGTKIFLGGSVPSVATKAEAERAARSAKGVASVKNQIAVVP